MSRTEMLNGLWESPITPRSLATDLRLTGIEWDSEGETLVWLEGRSDRGVLVAQVPGADAPRDLTSALSVRAEVGYGGGDFAVHGGSVIFVVRKEGRIYRQALAGGAARPITPTFGKAASPVVSPDGRWVAYVHSDEARVDRIGVVDAWGDSWPQILTSGHDFYMQPRWSPDGRQFAWIAWDHPRMPWDGTLLYVAPLVYPEHGPPHLGEARVVAGGENEAVFQPEFTPDGRSLIFVSDELGWGHLAVQDLVTGEQRWLTRGEAEYGMPAWVQDRRTYAVSATGRYAYAVRGERGFRRVERIALASGEAEPVAGLADYSDVDQIVAAPTGDRFAVIASSPCVPPRVVVHDGATGEVRVVARASGETVPAGALAQPEALEWATAGAEMAHGLYYPPASDRFEGIGRPPLVVLIHGGPTSQARARWEPSVQFLATRGYSVLQVNYRGSTGYGRPYMLRLRGNWGVCDVEDAVSGARHLIESGQVDPERTVIMGGSAGGFTVLQTMIHEPKAFTAGICLYGVSNHFILASDTHKFEERYLDSMLGPLPEAAPVYRERSPVFHAERIRRPLALFQGEIDRVVPRVQSETIVEALRRSGTPHVYHVYEGEGHGWRKSETVEHFWGAVDDFLRQFVLFA